MQVVDYKPELAEEFEFLWSYLRSSCWILFVRPLILHPVIHLDPVCRPVRFLEVVKIIRQQKINHWYFRFHDERVSEIRPLRRNIEI